MRAAHPQPAASRPARPFAIVSFRPMAAGYAGGECRAVGHRRAPRQAGALLRAPRATPRATPRCQNGAGQSASRARSGRSIRYAAVNNTGTRLSDYPVFCCCFLFLFSFLVRSAAWFPSTNRSLRRRVNVGGRALRVCPVTFVTHVKNWNAIVFSSNFFQQQFFLSLKNIILKERKCLNQV